MAGEMRLFRILAIDGGGIRGIIPARILQHIENAAGARADELFDLVVGTSTGGLIALGITSPQLQQAATRPTERMLDVYLNHGETIFAPAKTVLPMWAAGGAEKGASQAVKAFRKNVLGYQDFGHARHDPRPLENLLQELLGQSMVSAAHPEVIVTSYDLVAREPSLIMSDAARERPDADIQAWKAGRATSAAPTFFPPIEVTLEGRRQVLIDGGVAANNPVMVALASAGAFLDQGYAVSIVSIGTGRPDPPPADSITLDLASSSNAIHAAQDTMQILFDGTSEMQDGLTAWFATSFGARFSYKRFQTEMRGVPQAMNDPKTAPALLQLADLLAAESASEIADVARINTPG